MQSEWRLHSCSSETDVHVALNVLKEELYKIWQTSDPTEEEAAAAAAGGGGAEGEAWIIVEPHPPSAFSHIEIVNAGSALVEVYGLREPGGETNGGDRPHDDNEMDFEMLLSAQQLMSVKDVVNKSNRNRLFVFSTSDKLSPLAAQHRWKRVRVSCHQPFGSREHKAHIGLSRISFKCCQTSAEISAEAAEADLQKGLKNNLKKMFPESMSCDGDIVSKVTEPSKLVSTPKAAKLVVGSSDNSGSKRRIPSWESPKKKLKTNNRDNEVESGEHKDKANIGDEEENYKVKASEKSTSANKRFKGEELVTNRKCDAVSVSAEMKGSPTQRKEISQLSKDSKSYKQHQSPKEREIDEDFSKTESTRKQKGKRLLENTKKDLKDDAAEKVVAESRERKPPFHKFLNGVVFALSGLVNPERANIREAALQMGAQYRPDWTSDCTLLVCAFANTPKFNQVKNNNGTIVSKDWILDCYEKKELLDIDEYLMHAGKPWRKLDMFVYNAKDSTSGQKISPSSHRSEPRLTIASLPEIEQWVCTDVASSIEWLQKQENHPKPEEVKSIAIQGIELCLEDTIKCLKNKESIGKILETWDFVPRAVRELSQREKTTNDARDVSNFQDLLSEAERLKWIYALELKKLEGEGGNNLRDLNEDDDSTDKISDKSSSDTESDDETEILGEEDIIKAKEKIKKMLAGKAT